MEKSPLTTHSNNNQSFQAKSGIRKKGKTIISHKYYDEDHNKYNSSEEKKINHISIYIHE